MAVTITDVQKVSVAVSVTDAMGNPAAIEGAPDWTSSNPDIAVLEIADDGLSAEIVSVGPLGQATVTVAADADLGEGVVTIEGSLLVDVIASEATGIQITAGEPEPR